MVDRTSVLRYSRLMQGVLDRFTPATREWFESTFAAPTAPQVEGWRAIAQGQHTLIQAPTGSGKTLAAFLYCLDRLASRPPPTDPLRRCQVLYVSPLKALAHDVERNLKAPLVGIRLAAQRLGLAVPDIQVAIRTGDTPAAERRDLARTPPDILITTPESLYLLLTSHAREILRSVEWVIVDEVHSVAATKRGRRSGRRCTRVCWSWWSSTARRSSSSTAAAWPSAWPSA